MYKMYLGFSKIASGGLHWGRPILGTYHIGTCTLLLFEDFAISYSERASGRVGLPRQERRY